MISLILVLGLAGAAAGAVEFEPVTETCGVCHEQETAEWRESPHARTLNDEFLRIWEREGKKWECLVCHASQYDRATGAYSTEGVSCESCHGTLNENHPDDAKMNLPVTAETCQPCHSVTYGEWRISAHGQKNIRCFDCHQLHQMKLRQEDPDQLCGTCHSERLEDFSHATHHDKGLTCISCHMPEVGSGLKIKGTGARGHTTGVGAETCANCHREMVHEKGSQAAIEEELAVLRAQRPIELSHKLTEAQQEVDRLQLALQASKRVFVVVVLIAFALGLVVQYAVLYRRWRGGGRS